MDLLSVWIDESEKGDILVVSGVLCNWAAVLRIVNDWRKLKTALGLPPEAEIKWNLTSGHPTRKALEKLGKTTKELCEHAVDFIAKRDDLTCVAACMLEQRNLSLWKKLWDKASVRDFYCEGLKYLIQRAAEEVVEAKLQGCVIICDTPELGKKTFASGAIRRGRKAVEEAYQDWYRSGVGLGPGGQHYEGSLGDIGFHPSVFIGDATYHDMLQIADVVAGVTREWVSAVQNNPGINPGTSWETVCFKAVSGRFRSRHGKPGFFGDGFVLWPWQNELWERLKERGNGIITPRQQPHPELHLRGACPLLGLRGWAAGDLSRLVATKKRRITLSASPSTRFLMWDNDEKVGRLNELLKSNRGIPMDGRILAIANEFGSFWRGHMARGSSLSSSMAPKCAGRQLRIQMWTSWSLWTTP